MSNSIASDMTPAILRGGRFTSSLKFRIFAVERNCRQMSILPQLWTDDRGQDIAEYAVMLAVILVLVVGTIRLVGSNANNAFSSVASSIQ